MDVQSGLRGLGLELAAVEGVPSGAPLPCRGGAGGGVGNYLAYSRLLAGVAEVEVEGAGGVRVGGVAAGQAVAELEVGAEGAEPVAVGAGPVELVGGAQVEVDSGVGVDSGGAVGADEGDVGVIGGGGVVGGCVIGDGHAGEYGILQVVGVGVGGVDGGEVIGGHVVGDGPLHDVGDAGLDGGGGQELEVERAGLSIEAGVAGLAVAEGHEGGSFEWRAVELVTALGFPVADAEGQAERVPCAVLVEGAAHEHDVVGGAVGGEGGDAVGVAVAVGQSGVVVIEDGGAVVGGALDVGDERLAVELGRIVVDGADAEDFAAVIEALAVGDVHGFAVARGVAAGRDVVGGAGPAEGDVAVIGTDAVLVAGGGDLAAGDGDAAVGLDASAVGAGGVDGAAVDGDVAVSIDAIAVGAGGVDGAAADDDIAVVMEDAGVGGGDVEGAGAESLAVDGQGAVVAIDACAIAGHAHGLAVGEDDVHVVVAVNLVAVADVGADEVPRLLSVLAEAALRAVEGDGAGGIGSSVLSVAEDAVGVDVADADGLAGAAQLVAGREADGDVLVGHGERRAAERCAARGAVVAVLVAEGRVGGAVRERQAHLVVHSGVEHIIIYDTGDEGVAVAAGVGCLVGGDAADAVLGGHSVVSEGDALAGGEGAELLALCGAEGAGVVAVGHGGVVAGEGGAGMVVYIASLYLGLASAEVGGGVEAVGDGAVAIAHEAAAVGGGVGAGGEQLAVEHAAVDGERAAV